MTEQEYLNSKNIVTEYVEGFTDRNGWKNTSLPTLLKDYKQQLILHGVVKSLPSKETIISEAIKYQDGFLDDPHSIADEAFIEGCNFILTALREDKIVR